MQILDGDNNPPTRNGNILSDDCLFSLNYETVERKSLLELKICLTFSACVNSSLLKRITFLEIGATLEKSMLNALHASRLS